MGHVSAEFWRIGIGHFSSARKVRGVRAESRRDGAKLLFGVDLVRDVEISA
jgi:hypothetical protein